MDSITVIVPCYNEAAVIAATYGRLRAVLDLLDRRTCILFVDDGSIDGTFGILSGIAEVDSSVRVLRFSRNFGHQAAVTAGIHHCDTGLAVIIDADLQDPPEIIPELLATRDLEGANVVYCVRKSRSGEGRFKLWTSKRFYRFLNCLSEVRFPVDTGDFRLIDSRIIEEFRRFKERGKYIRGIISWVGFKQVPFYYERESRLAGETKYPFRRMLSFASTALFYFSKKPLLVAVGLGFAAVLIGLVLALWYFFGKVFGYTGAASGWTSIMIAVIFFGGIQLLTIGVLGQYIGILFDEVKERPEYIVERTIN
ncbi:MAG: glycosyltransferase family 2 protein [Dysgonamonadaceae bacterium]|nr:glycosyltransferase family 2 protein [Dysgonamonadaceae bacterium]